MNQLRLTRRIVHFIVLTFITLASCSDGGEKIKTTETIPYSSITVRNNTGDTIFQSFAYKDVFNSGWTSKGHYKIAPYSSFYFEIPNLSGEAYSGDFYVRALGIDSERNDLKQFCIDPVQAYEILNADIISCNTRESFFNQVIEKGRNKVIINPAVTIKQ